MSAKVDSSPGSILMLGDTLQPRSQVARRMYLRALRRRATLYLFIGRVLGTDGTRVYSGRRERLLNPIPSLLKVAILFPFLRQPGPAQPPDLGLPRAKIFVSPVPTPAHLPSSLLTTRRSVIPSAMIRSRSNPTVPVLSRIKRSMRSSP